MSTNSELDWVRRERSRTAREALIVSQITGSTIDAPTPGAHDSNVSDTPTRAEMEARLGEVKAQTETQFEKLRGDIREMRGAMVGKTSFFFGLLALFAGLVAVLAYGGQWFGLGLQSHDALVAAAKEGARQALAIKGS